MSSSSDEDAVGPLLPPDPKRPRKKARRQLQYQALYLNALPSTLRYTRSYMHRSILTHVTCTPKFSITASDDGQLKFWARKSSTSRNTSHADVEFVKAFQAHRGPLHALSLSPDASLLCTVSAADMSLKIFSVTAFDMLDFAQLSFRPAPAIAWVSRAAPPASEVAVAHAEQPVVSIFRMDDLRVARREIHLPHVAPISLMRFNPLFNAVVSIDQRGFIEYWRPEELPNEEDSRADIPGVSFSLKSQTDLFEFAKNKTTPTSLEISPNGSLFTCMALDRIVRVFTFGTGKLKRSYDESLETVSASISHDDEKEGTTEQDSVRSVPSHEFNRRMAREQQVEADATGSLARSNVIFDASSHFILYTTVLGIKIVNLTTNKLVRLLGLREAAERFLQISLFPNAAASGGNDDGQPPLLVASSFDSQRIYLFGSESNDALNSDRDVFNERPMVRHSGKKGSKIVDVESEKKGRIALPKRATLHTTAGDIIFSLMCVATPKTVENFSTHAKNGYYNSVLFHRVIKGFMIQTGDPDGDGTGGESIWGGSFEDEIDKTSSHEGGTVSMANAGPNTNGSQFFITCAAAKHLDGKHTIFGKVTKGMGVVHEIENEKVDKNDRPLTAIRIESVSVHLE